jgi:hypothetical protein
MSMDSFTEAYEKLRDVVVTDTRYAQDWQAFLKQQIAPLLGASGPETAHAASLDRLRKKLADSSRGRFAAFFFGGGVGETIVAAGNKEAGPAGLSERCAAIKMLKHLYRAEKSGAQSVWILSPPKAYSRWVFDEIRGTEKDLAHKLANESEVYSASNRKTMCAALHQAKLSAEYAATKLGSPDAATTTTFKRWFDDGSRQRRRAQPCTRRGSRGRGTTRHGVRGLRLAAAERCPARRGRG